jgi:hypothetical protein
MSLRIGNHLRMQIDNLFSVTSQFMISEHAWPNQCDPQTCCSKSFAFARALANSAAAAASSSWMSA